MDTPDLTPCYCAYCPACGGMVAVTVACVEEPEELRVALKHRSQWERSGLRLGSVTVQAVRDGALTGHAVGCRNIKRGRGRQNALPLAAREQE